MTITIDKTQAKYLSVLLTKNRNEIRNKKLTSKLNHKEIEQMILASQLLRQIIFQPLYDFGY